MERGFGIVTEVRPDAVGDQRVKPRALVHFIEVRQRLVLVEHPSVASGPNRRPFHIIKQAFRQIRRRRQILQALLILNADGVAAILIGDAHSRDVHPALLDYLAVCQLGFGIGPCLKPHAAGVQPGAHALRLLRRYALHGRVERRLAQPLLEHAGRMQQFVRNNGVVHAHAAFVENRVSTVRFPRMSVASTLPIFSAREGNVKLASG